MDSTSALLIAMLVLMSMLIANVPVALVLLTSGAVGIMLLRDSSVAGSVLGGVPFSAVSSYSLVVVPMFILLGMFALRAGLARDLFGIGNKLLGTLPGGLGVSTVATCAGFAAVTGSSVATVATLGRMAIMEMEKFGYNRYFSAGIVGAGGTLGVLIPPSIILVIYGIVTQESIGALLLAGIIPGIVSAIAYASVVVIKVKANPELIRVPVPAQSSSMSTEARDDSDAIDEAPVGAGVWAVFKVLTIFSIVIGGIYFGVFTATESGALAALAGLIILMIGFRRNFPGMVRQIIDAIKETVALTSMSFAILVGAGVFSFFLVAGRLPAQLTSWVVGLDLPPTLIVALMVLALIPLGMFLDSLSIVVITVPLMYEPITALGFDGIWLGIIVVKLVEIGLITPPVGLNAFVLSGTMPGLDLGRVFRGLVPFVVADLVVVALLFAWPDMATWLPEVTMNK